MGLRFLRDGITYRLGPRTLCVYMCSHLEDLENWDHKGDLKLDLVSSASELYPMYIHLATSLDLENSSWHGSFVVKIEEKEEDVNTAPLCILLDDMAGTKPESI